MKMEDIMKKILSAMLAAALCVSLAACSSDEGSSSSVAEDGNIQIVTPTAETVCNELIRLYGDDMPYPFAYYARMSGTEPVQSSIKFPSLEGDAAKPSDYIAIAVTGTNANSPSTVIVKVFEGGTESQSATRLIPG